MSSQLRASAQTFVSLVAILLTAVLTQAQLQPSKTPSYKEKVLHAFTGQSDGWMPDGLLLRDAKGNLYGSTAFGGSLSGQCGYDGCGVVFKVSAGRKFSVLHTFEFSDGAWPSISVQDTSGNLYGTTYHGGNTGSACQYGGCGVIFKVTPARDFTLLYSFTGGSDGANPTGLIMDDQGNFYGVTTGTNTGFEEVFELTNSRNLKVLYVFPHDGFVPNGVIRDRSGNLFGTTIYGGAYGGGTVFKLDTSGNETVLYSFKGGSDGGYPQAPLVMDKTGNLYGTTAYFGYEKGNCYAPPDYIPGCGTVFKVNTAGVFSRLFPFHYSDGDYPGPLMENADGAIYGTTAFGGNACGGCGVVFKLTPDDKESVLYKFKGGWSGYLPVSLVQDSTENLYGATGYGGDLSCPYNIGYGCGVVFELTP